MSEAIFDPRLLVLANGDNIAVLKATIAAGEVILVAGEPVTISATLGLGHKLAVTPIPQGKDVVKYGFPIGFAAEDVGIGEHVHVHNLSSRYTAVEIME
ncbi:SAF domain-containing protein [Shimia isoporae]|uniref:SAF domain-containing protein n=1 Tax=Shimia isoporae TaxID=647720 RepID=A0A4R1NYK7_9RHOB|nr:UxaA family hydrolase [Shimia isoporae]TCL10312.1 SAF domain-containing protein [Shimia isoporae]